MKVLIVSNKFPPNAHGGYEVSAGVVAQTLLGLGHQVVVATSTHHLGSWQAAPAVKVDFTFRPMPWYHPSSAEPPPELPVFTPRQIADAITGCVPEHDIALANLIKQERPHLIWAFNIRRLGPLGVMLTCLSSGVPTLFHFQDYLDNDFIEYANTPEEYLALRELKRLVFGVFCSRICAEHSCLIGHFTHQTIAHTYGPAPFTVQPAFHAFTPPARLKVIHAGTLNKDKGTDIVVEGFTAVARKYPGRLQLQLIGGGNHVFIEQLRQADVEISNQLEQPEVLEKIGQSHVAILPLRTEEPFGLVAYEAVRAGCVTLVGHKAGSAEKLDPGHNYLPLYTRTSAEIAQHLENILLAPQNYRMLAANAWATPVIVPPETFVKKILALKDTIPVPNTRQLATAKKFAAAIATP